jgi:hypothetical protein
VTGWRKCFAPRAGAQIENLRLEGEDMSMTKQSTLAVLQQAAAHLLLTAEAAPDQEAEEMRSIAAQLQALIVSPYFLTSPEKAVPAVAHRQ